MIIENKLRRVEQKNKLFQDDLLNKIHQRNEIVEKTNDFIKSSIPLYNILIEGVFLESIKKLEGYGQIVNKWKNDFESAYKGLNRKYQIDKDIDTIDKNLFLIKIDLLRKLIDILLSNDKHLPDDIYDQLSFRQKIASFNILEDDWDSYGALRVSKTTIRHSLVLFDNLGDLTDKACFVYPTIEGKVGIDFKNSKHRVEIKFIDKNYITASILNNKKHLIKSEKFKTVHSLINFLKKIFNE